MRERVRAVAVLALAGVAFIKAPARDAENEDRYPLGEIVPKVVCRSDPRYSFALYLPKAFGPGRRWPLLLLFDARGRGALAADRFREGAERFGWILASSNDTRSDDPSAPNSAAIQALWNDVQARLPVDTRRIATSGFSGGARLAFAVAMSRGTASAGVIAASGGLPAPGPARSDPGFPVFGTAGERDFNYLEMRALDRSLAKTGAAHRLEVFAGGHEWPPAAVAGRAMAWLEIRAMRRGARDVDRPLAAELLGESVALAESLEARDDVEGAYEEAAAAARDFDGLADTAKAAAVAARLKPRAMHARAEAERREAREAEAALRLRGELEKILAETDPLPFATVAARLEIARWRERASSGPEPERLSAARVVEGLYTAAVFYEPRALLARNEPRRAALSLEIAAAVKPDAPAAWYDLACARARAGDSRRALEALATALEKGFRDAKLLATDPDLAPLRALPRFRELAKRIED